uniref:Uncharacterized protein n=2 Tax=viral metagenome TaxID=1070528 RepID=A0A6H1ZWD0_9ZZZZ
MKEKESTQEDIEYRPSRIHGAKGILECSLEPPQELPSDDPWRHRSKGMKCRTCMFFVRKFSPVPAKPLGRCRRRAPTMNGYPAVFLDDWCGDHKIDEEKI